MQGSETSGNLVLGRSNNLGIVKFIAAILVIVSHAYALSVDTGYDWLWSISKHRLSLGGFAVSVFFFSSGLLVTKSLYRNSDPFYFFGRRAARIFPPLIFVTLVSTFVMGPLVTSLEIGQYFSSRETYLYLLNGICILHHELPGVFEGNIYGPTVNGALWTMPVEVLCYIAGFLWYKFRMNNRIFTLGIVCSMTVVLHVVSLNGNSLMISACRAALMYCCGMAVFVYRDKVVLRKSYFAAAVMIMMISVFTPVFNLIFPAALSYTLLYLCWESRIQCKVSLPGDYSYGIYLSGFPIQQCVIHFFGGSMDPHINMAVSIPLSIAAGIIIHNLIEKPIERMNGRNIFLNIYRRD